MQAMKTSRIAMAAIASSIMLAPAAQAFDFKVSGQVSRMLVMPDDAVGDEWQFQDIGWSGTRFRFTGSEKADNGLTWGFRYEIQARTNAPGADGSQLSSTGDNQDNRLQDLFVSGGFGKVSFGKGDGASNGATEVDLSGTALSSTSNLQDNWGGYAINASGKEWSTVYKMFDGLSRQNRVRYDTPNFSGFSAAASINQGNASELALTYKGEFGGNQLRAAIFTAQDADVSATVDGNDLMGLSASLLLDSGFNFTVAYSESEVDSSNPTNPGETRDATFVKAGYKQGKHAVSIDFAESDNDRTDEEGESTGLTYAYFPMSGVEVFAMYRELDSTNVANSESVDLASIGGRIKF